MALDTPPFRHSPPNPSIPGAMGPELSQKGRRRDVDMRRRMPRSVASFWILAGLLFAALLSFAWSAQAAVIAIDYGTQWFKVSLVKPGVPLEIVLNRESKRKTRSIVALRDGKRTFDTEAVNLAARFPKVTFDSLKSVIGKPFEDPVCEAYRATFDNSMVKDPVRGTAAFKQPDGSLLAAEELVAMQFKHAKELADTMAGDPVRDCVITIPRFFNQYERQAILDAAELAGLRILALIHDDFAVALNFAMTRNFNETAPEYHIFYDMGSGSTTASLVSFQNVPADPRLPKKTIPQLEVKSVGFDMTLGGLEFDRRLQSLLAKTFDKEKSSSSGAVFKNQRAMMKLLNQATKVKEVLSANTEIGVSIEGVMDDIDFRTKVTRQELEEITKDLIDRVTVPVKTVVERAGLTMDAISSVILVGGGTRVPAVQAALRELVGEEKIAKNVNSDEAAVMGAGFRGAGISKQFKVRDIRVKDVNVFPVEVAYAAEAKEGKEERIIRTLLFADGAVLPSRKLMTFRRNTAFNFTLGYRAEEGKPSFQPPVFIEAEVPGVAEAIAAFKANESLTVIGDPKIKATIALSESGLVNVVEIGAYFDVEVAKEQKSFKDRVMSFFGGKSENGTANSTESESSPDGTGPGPITEEKGEAANETSPEPASKKTEIKTERVALNLTVTAAGIVPMDQPAKAKALTKLLAMDAEDRARQQLAEAKNQLEAFTYSLRDFLSDDDSEKCSTESEREKLSAKVSEASEWLYTEGETAELAAVRGKLSELQALKAPIETRRREKKARPDAVKSLRETLDAAKLWVDETRAKNKEAEEKSKKELEEAANAAPAKEEPKDKKSAETPSDKADKTSSTSSSSSSSAAAPPTPFVPLHTEEELSSLVTLAESHLSWLNTKQTEQEKLEDHVDPVLLVADIERKADAVKKEMLRLMRRKRPVAKKATISTSSSSKTTKSTETTQTPVTIKPEATPEAAEEKVPESGDKEPAAESSEQQVPTEETGDGEAKKDEL